MRKPRDFDAELKALSDKVSSLKERRIRQLGELVIACGGDAMPAEQLAGALLEVVATKDAATVEGWKRRGAAFFQGERRSTGIGTRAKHAGTAAGNDSAQSPPASGSSAE